MAKTATEGQMLPWDRVRLTPIETEDLELIHGWQNDPAVRDLTMGFRFPVQRDAVRDWIASLRTTQVATRAAYCIRLDGLAVGITHLYDIDPYQRTAEFGIFLADPDLRGQGAGQVAASLVLDFAFRGLDLRRVSLEVLATSSAAIALYERLGFHHEGTRRQGYFADGRSWDSRLYGLLRGEFPGALPAAAARLCLTLP